MIHVVNVCNGSSYTHKMYCTNLWGNDEGDEGVTWYLNCMMTQDSKIVQIVLMYIQSGCGPLKSTRWHDPFSP